MIKRLPKSKMRALARTAQRRKYNALVDGHKEPPQSAKEAMKHKPYGMGVENDEGSDRQTESD